VYARELPVYLPKALRSTVSDLSDDDYATDEFDADSDIEEIYEQARNMSLSPKAPASLLTSPFKSDTGKYSPLCLLLSNTVRSFKFLDPSRAQLCDQFR
jgi:hypothetical protein